MDNNPYEVLRARYKPEKVKVLFIGESRPAGGTFFYNGDSNLARYTREAFERAFGVRYHTPGAFLEDFRRRSFFLEDLCEGPLNGLSRRDRGTRRRKSEYSLALRVRKHDPSRIICVMSGILPNVRHAALGAGFPTSHIDCLRFPAMGHQRAYVGQLAGLLPHFT